MAKKKRPAGASKKNRSSSQSQRSPGKQKKSPPRRLPKPLAATHTFNACPSTAFSFKNTNQFGPSHDIISQDRAVRAIEMGLGIRKPGYNIYVAGVHGTGKTSVIRTFLEKWSADSAPPSDWIYVYNFNDPEQARAIELPAGGGRTLRKKMETLIKNLRDEIPRALQSEEYENAVNSYMSSSNERKAKLFADLERLAKSMDFTIKSTRMGIETIPVVEGRALTEKEYGKLSDEQRTKIEEQRSQLEPEVLDFARKVRAIEQETSQYIEKLRGELGESVVGGQIDPLIEEYKDHEQVLGYLKEVREHILENLLEFTEEEEGAGAQGGDQDQPPPPAMLAPEERDRYRKYKVNVFVDNTGAEGAPVIIETNPTYYNLFGRIEKNLEHGMYMTDFTMVKPGSIHRASGGYLVVNAMDVFKTPSIWDTLKRVLKNRKGFIEDMGEQFSLLPTSGLRPEPIPLDVKVIMVGNDEIYHMLYDLDDDFQKIFKIKADFDYKMPRDDSNVNSYASFIATRTKLEKLLPYDRSGVAAVVEFGSRLVEDQRFLSTQFGELKDLTIEADFIAREQNAKAVGRGHVETALNQKFHRLNLIEEQLLEMVEHEDILLTVDGEKIGQVNGLTVYDMGDYTFGKLGRITCTVSTSDDGIVNVERASKLSGKIHDKGIYILTGFLSALLARERRLGFAASVCFEQSYGMIDGDSATVAELIAVLSAMSEIPVRQNYAMTGSLNQFGEIQPVGGINEKIEGFHKTCRLIGKGDQFNLIVPKQNVTNLMLHGEVRESIKSGYLNIYPAGDVREAFELATGRPLGYEDFAQGEFLKGSALDLIAKKLDRIHQEHIEEEKDIHVGGQHTDSGEKQTASSNVLGQVGGLAAGLLGRAAAAATRRLTGEDPFDGR